EGIDEIAVSVFLEALQGHGPAGRIADEAFQLIAAMDWNLRVGMQGKALDAGTARTGEAWRLTLVAKAGTQAPDLLAHPFPQGDALRNRGRQGPGERGCVLHQGVRAGRHRRVAPRFQVSQVPEFAHDPPTDLLHDVCHVGITGWLTCDK